MKVIYSGRKTGRTQHLINLAAEAEKNGEVSYIVCRGHDEAYRIAQRAKEQGLNIGFPITYEEFVDKRYYGRNIKQFFIDNADYLLQYISAIPIAAITLEKRDEE